LCVFLNITEGSKLARTEVTKYIIDYIKTHNLQDDTNKKNISPDVKLRSLLGVESEHFDYFSLQKYMNKHFITEKNKINEVDI
jgi:chromatin remodeling complex protein RSC6